MYNPDFWEVPVNPGDLEHFANEVGLWYESSEDRQARYEWEDRIQKAVERLEDLIEGCLTQRQREALLLYFFRRKTQEEVAAILGISRRVVSQHLFGIRRDGKQVGGAVKKIQKCCRRNGIEGEEGNCLTQRPGGR